MRKFLVNINGNQYEVEVEEITLNDNIQASNVVSKPVEINKVEKVSQPKMENNVNGTKITAPMPGMIKSFKVNNGDMVKEGDVVLVLEAMKMDNDITAPCSGVVSIKSSVGSNVETGDVMVIIG